MLNKVFVLLAALCLLNVATAYRLPRAADKKGSDESSEEFTEADLKVFQAELEKNLPKEKADEITSVFSKFTTGKTSEENFEGVLGLIVLLFANDLESKEAAKDGVEENAVVTKSSKADFTAVLRSALNSTDSSEKSSEEFTEKDLQELKAALEKELPKEKVEKIVNVFSKFTEGNAPEKQMEGFFELIALLVESVIESEATPSVTTDKAQVAVVELTENTV